MNKMFAVAALFFKLQIAYRVDVFATVVGTVSRILFAWLVWGAVFAGRDNIGGFYLETMLAYYVISALIVSLDICFGISSEIAATIRGGSFSKFMVLPINPQIYWLGRCMGWISFLALFIFPVALLSGLMFGAGGVDLRLASILLGFVMVPAGLAFMVLYHIFIGLLAFKFQEVWLFLHVQSTFIEFTQGAWIPLILLPEAALRIISFLPFPHVVFTPTMLIIGKMDLHEGLVSFGILLLWIAGMAALGQFTYHRLRIKYDGVGV